MIECTWEARAESPMFGLASWRGEDKGSNACRGFQSDSFMEFVSLLMDRLHEPPFLGLGPDYMRIDVHL